VQCIDVYSSPVSQGFWQHPGVRNTGKEADRLIGGSLPGATSVEVHEMTIAMV